MQTYDIAQAGPRNRFTILTDAGPLIVHNCGYQLGWASFAAQLLVGFLGADPKRYTKDEAKQLGVTGTHIERFINNKWHMEKMAEIPRTCTDAELLIHCLAAKAIVEKYRGAAEPVVAFWKMLQERIVTSLIGGEEYAHKGVFTIKKEEIVLVNGMSLKYPSIEICKDERGHTEYRFGIGDKKGKLYAGRLCIGEGTPVLTARGWVPIEEVQTYDWVHDGIDFVHHSGVVAKGVQGCITVDGVYMTPDHEVLTNDGWKKASQLPKPYRPSIRYEQTQHGADRYRSHDAVQPDKSGLACGAANAQTVVQQQTYDIGDCGPRNRFVVMGSEGPFIVHNCNNIVQALARIVMSDGMLRIAKRYDVVGTVHDEVLALVPEQEAKEGLLWMKEQMVLEPKWLPGIPLKSDGGFHKRYGEAKT
jgi:hypothetical protein